LVKTPIGAPSGWFIFEADAQKKFMTDSIRRFSVLVVEDEPLIAEDIAGILEEIGFRCAGICYDAASVIQYLKEEKPDVVLLDINLGDGPDGIEVAGIIRAECKIPFVFLTGQADRATVERAKQTFPAGYLLKPFESNDLMVALEIALHNFRASNWVDHLFSNLNVLKSNPVNPLSDREID
jgi:AmiR/NasT family two-component response regulator